MKTHQCGHNLSYDQVIDEINQTQDPRILLRPQVNSLDFQQPLEFGCLFTTIGARGRSSSLPNVIRKDVDNYLKYFALAHFRICPIPPRKIGRKYSDPF